MKLEEQITSVELSNKLKKLGVTEPSIFFRDWTGAKKNEIEMCENYESAYCIDNVNCYTVAELGKMLPYHIRIEVKSDDIWFYECTTYKTNEGYAVAYICEERLNDKIFQDDTEANARAKMLIHLLEIKLI